MKVYLDNCCFNRPFDDQDSLRISLETQAKLEIQSLIKEGRLEFVSSYMLQFENSRNPYEMRRRTTEDFAKTYTNFFVSYENKDKVESIAEDIIATGVKSRDAIHVASAIYAGCDYFLTTDDRLLRYETNLITLCNPVDFIRMEVEKDNG